MKEIRLETGPAQDKYVRGDFLLARLEFSDSELTVTVGPDRPESARRTSKLWSQTVYQLENLAMGLRYVALEGLPERYEVPSREGLLGPSVGLKPALHFELGHPGIGAEGRATEFYCSFRFLPWRERKLVDLRAITGSRAEQATFEVEDVLRIAEQLYEQATALAPRLISWEADTGADEP